jgi:hypothetical protein
MNVNRKMRNYSFTFMLCLVVVGCSSAPIRVPLVYQGPTTAREQTKLAEGVIRVDDQRQDKSLDAFISPSVPEAIRSAMSRELAAAVCVPGSTHGNPAEALALPVQIQVQLIQAAAGVPGHDGKVAGQWVGVLAGGIVGGAVVALSKTDVVGEVQMRVHAHNVQSGADCEDTWTGVNTIKEAKGNMDSSQTISKVFGGAVKQAMSNLPGILTCVGLEPK